MRLFHLKNESPFFLKNDSAVYRKQSSMKVGQQESSVKNSDFFFQFYVQLFIIYQKHLILNWLTC